MLAATAASAPWLGRRIGPAMETGPSRRSRDLASGRVVLAARSVAWSDETGTEIGATDLKPFHGVHAVAASREKGSYD
jgi:hypothetical protein